MTEVTATIGIPSIYESLNNVKKAVGAVKKRETNKTQGFNFRGIDSVVNATAQALNDAGVITTPELIDHHYETVEIGKNRTPMAHVMVTVCYRFWGPGGDHVESTVLAEAMDSGDKACAKAMSVAYRIALLQTLNLPTDEPDPDSVSYERSGGAESAPARRPGKTGTATDWAGKIAAAATVDALRKVWKEAGGAGALQAPAVTADGEKTTVQEMLYTRHDELSFKSGADSAASAAGV